MSEKERNEETNVPLVAPDTKAFSRASGRRRRNCPSLPRNAALLPPLLSTAAMAHSTAQLLRETRRRGSRKKKRENASFFSCPPSRSLPISKKKSIP